MLAKSRGRQWYAGNRMAQVQARLWDCRCRSCFRPTTDSSSRGPLHNRPAQSSSAFTERRQRLRLCSKGCQQKMHVEAPS